MADETTDDDELGFAEAMTFLADRVGEEEEQFEHDVPDHAPSLVVDEATELLQTATSIEMAEEMAEQAEDEEGVEDEDKEEALLEDVVNLLTAVAALKHEEDLDITTAVEDRMAFIEDYKQFEEAMEAAEDRDEQMEAMDEHLTDEIAAELGVGEMPEGPTIGESVDREGYDHDEVDKNFH